MKGMRRLSIGFRAKVDEIFSGMENHEALAQSALSDLKESVGGARVGLARLKRDEARLRDEHGAALSKAGVWRDRAKQEGDQDRALDCLRRAKQCQTHADTLDKRLLEQRRASERLACEVRQLENRYSELSSRYQIMRTREARARAFESLQADLAGLGGDVEQVFEGWEGRVVRSETFGGLSADFEEDLEDRYLQDEERVDLLAELEALRAEPDAPVGGFPQKGAE
jgi:phage shock protein A